MCVHWSPIDMELIANLLEILLDNFVTVDIFKILEWKRI